MFEAMRRVLQLPNGDEQLDAAGPEYSTEEIKQTLRDINDGKEPPRIQKIQLDREERNYLRELGSGLPDEERKALRLKFEADFLLDEAQKVEPQIPKMKAERDPGYPPMRKRALETMLDQMEDAGVGEVVDFMRREVFHPGFLHGIRVVRDVDEQTLVWDPQRDELHVATSEGPKDERVVRLRRLVRSVCLMGSAMEQRSN